MVKYFRFLAAIVAAVCVLSSGNGGNVSAAVLSPINTTEVASNASLSTTSPIDNKTDGLTRKNTCVLANFQTATADFIALNNLVTIIKTSPAMIKQYVSDPVIIIDHPLATLDTTLFSHTFKLMPTVDWLNITGITALAPLLVNVTSPNTLDLGMSFSGNITVDGTLTIVVAQLNRKWYNICWVNLLHPFTCQPHTYKVAMTLTVSKPQIVTHMKADLYECAPGIPTSTCQNLTMTSIMTGALGGNLTGVSEAIYNNFKDVRISTLALDWDTVFVMKFVVYNSDSFVTKITNSLLDFSAQRLNVKGYFRRAFLDISQTLLLSLVNKVIDSTFKPLFGATCL